MTRNRGIYVSRRSSLADRLAFYSIEADSGCREWTGGTDGRLGYGKLRWDGRMQLAHRLAYIEAHGPIPDGVVVMHECDNPRCVRLEHLRLGTQQENVHDCHERKRASARAGESNNSARLTSNLVAAVRRRRSEGALLREIAAEFSISQSQASNIVNYRQWKDDVMLTVQDAIDRFGIDVLDHLDREATVPILSGRQRQGDVYVRPERPSKNAGELMSKEGVPVVRGENGGNTHHLIADGPAYWLPSVSDDPRELSLGTVTIPAGSTAFLAHPEHGYLGLAPGAYRLRRQREQADIIRRVAD